jgi:hypothetical protein
LASSSFAVASFAAASLREYNDPLKEDELRECDAMTAREAPMAVVVAFRDAPVRRAAAAASSRASPRTRRPV